MNHGQSKGGNQQGGNPSGLSDEQGGKSDAQKDHESNLYRNTQRFEHAVSFLRTVFETVNPHSQHKRPTRLYGRLACSPGYFLHFSPRILPRNFWFEKEEIFPPNPELSCAIFKPVGLLFLGSILCELVLKEDSILTSQRRPTIFFHLWPLWFLPPDSFSFFITQTAPPAGCGGCRLRSRGNAPSATVPRPPS